jgi:neutral trehalase
LVLPSFAGKLTADFYKGDRSVRESGFDITFRYGPYAAGTHHYADVGLNCLLYKAETDLERMSTLLSKSAEAGYTQNVVGFGWTNGVFLVLLHSLPADWTRRIPGQ